MGSRKKRNGKGAKNMFDRQKEYKRVLRFKRLKELAKGRDTDNKRVEKRDREREKLHVRLKERENKKSKNRECKKTKKIEKSKGLSLSWFLF